MGSIRRRAGLVLLLVGMISPAGIREASADPAAGGWSGFYLGGNLGAGIGDSDLKAGVAPDTTYFDTGTDSAQVAGAGSGTTRLGSFTGGVVAGYNAQFGNILLGLEAGANGFDFDQSHSGSATFISDPNIQFTVTQTVKSNWIATLRPRLGWVHDNCLVYVTGGLALTRVELDAAYSDNNSQPGLGLPGAYGNGSASVTKVGWTLGAGGEYALSRNWSLTGQYLFVDFGSVHASAQVIPTPTLAGFSSVIDGSGDLRTNLILVGATYRFEDGLLP